VVERSCRTTQAKLGEQILKLGSDRLLTPVSIYAIISIDACSGYPQKDEVRT
jgi:hypothetical protein